MIRRLKIALIFIMALLIFPSDRSFANLSGGGLFASPNRGGGGGGGSAPRYYSFEELRNGIRGESFYFQNDNKPTNALADLGYFISYPACAAKNAKIASSIKSKPSDYKIDSFHVYTGWNDNIEIPFDWNGISSYAIRGDLIFTRGNGKGPDFVKTFSNWTHVAIVENVQLKKVFESTVDKGVKVNYGPDTFKNITYYTCKRIEIIPYNARSYLLDQAINKYSNLPYFPKMSVEEALFRFLFVWSDKNDTSSMYCSKLVYQTFKNQINLDTGRTSLPYDSSLADKNKPAPGGYLFSWIGISPDDIYYLPSLALGPDFCYSSNLKDI